jgi:sugar fermentation stimulation protein A
MKLLSCARGVHATTKSPMSSLIPHRWPGPPLEARLVSRPNKFLAVCSLQGRTVEAHVPDRGRALDLMVEGQPVILVAAPPAAPGAPPRKTPFTLVLARAWTPPAPWVCMDPAGAPRLVEAALLRGLLPSLAGLRVVRREVAHGKHSRIDLLLGPMVKGFTKSAEAADDDALVLCEVKSVGAARDGLALFPDAPTERGARHLAELARLQRKREKTGRGLSAAVVFVAQRGDVRAVAPDREIDPAFAAALARARKAGVRLAALGCTAHPEGMELGGELQLLA